MKQQPDSLFSEKLRDLELKAPASAWARIETATAKKPAFTWMSVAAALLVLAIASAAFIWINKPDQTVSPLAESTINKNQVPTQATPEVVIESTPEAQEDEGIIEATSSKIEKTNPLPRKQSTQTTSTQVDVQVESTESNPGEVTIAYKVPEIVVEIAEVAQPETVVVTTTVTEEANKVHLVIESDVVNQRYLKKSVAEATDETKKESGIRKLLDKAGELKNDQNPFGELRQMKNEVLAFNFTAKKTEQIK